MDSDTTYVSEDSHRITEGSLRLAEDSLRLAEGTTPRQAETARLQTQVRIMSKAYHNVLSELHALRDRVDAIDKIVCVQEKIGRAHV